MNGFRSVRTWSVMCWALLIFSAGRLPAEDALPPSWTCLPDDACFVARVPNASAFADAMRTRTKLGQLIFNVERWQRLRGIAEEELGESWDKFFAEWQRLNLKLEDLGSLVSGEMGMALVVQPRPEQLPRVMALWWLEPEGDLAERMIAALKQAIEEHADPKRMRRVDLELASTPVMRLTLPVYDLDYDSIEAEPIDFDSATEEQIEAWRKRRAEAIANAQRVVTDERHWLIARLGRRILIANTFGGNVSSGEDPPADLEAISGIEECTGMFARFLGAHASGAGGPPSFSIGPGVAAALPQGAPLLEAFLDSRQLIKLTEGNEEALQMLRVAGIENLGPLAMRLALDGNIMRSGVFLSMPGPRTGFLRLLQQKALPSEPPPWVSSSAVGYTQMSFDLSGAYATIKEVVAENFAEQAAFAFPFIEGQCQALFQTDVPTLLKSIGSSHGIVTYVPQKSKQPPAEGEDPSAATDRAAFVWQVSDENLLRRVLQVGAKLGGMEAVEEQGFTGLRMPPTSPVEGGLFLGQGFLTFAMGDGVAETTLAALRNPPSGEASFRGGAAFRRAGELLPLEPSFAFSVSDENRIFDSVRDQFNTAMEQFSNEMQRNNGGDADFAHRKEVIKKVLDALPSAEQWEGIFGVSVNIVTMDDSGITARAAAEFAAP